MKKKLKGRLIRCGLAALLFFPPLLYGIYRIETLPLSDGPSVSIIQPNIPPEEKVKNVHPKKQAAILSRLSTPRAGERPDLIVWPEAARPGLLRHDTGETELPEDPWTGSVASRLGVPILTGTAYQAVGSGGGFSLYNAAFLFDGTGSFRGFYAKRLLVPFSEGTPFFPGFIKKRGSPESPASTIGLFSPGPEWKVFAIPGKEEYRFGVTICYEAIFAEPSRLYRASGCDFIVNMTNDGWFKGTFIPVWHARANRLRAVENRVAVVRCANNGISGFIDPLGRPVGWTPFWTRAAVFGKVTTSPVVTFYTRHGDIVVLLAALVFGYALFSHSRARVAGGKEK